MPVHSSKARDRARLIRRRRWPRRLLVVVNVAVATALICSGAAYAYVKLRIDSIRTLTAPHLTRTVSGGKDSADGLSPENILLIGNETRAGLTNPNEIAAMGSPEEFSGSLSDVIMILHFNPATRSASILSIPRDLFVPMPAGSPVGSYQKIDAALNDGADGPDNLIEAIQDDLGIPINHFVELEFDGFENTVNALGGIDMDFPDELYDANSQLHIGYTGCLHLNGTEALALVRSRHLQYDPPGDYSPAYTWPYDPESDLSRIVRDHTFLRVLVSTAKSQGLTNPLKMNAFLGAVINQITVDPGLKGQLVALATHYRNISPANIPELTLPITTVSDYYFAGYGIGDVDFPSQPADDSVIAQWDGSALPDPVAPTAVDVYSATEGYGVSDDAATALTSDGLKASDSGAAEVQANTSETYVEYPAGGQAYPAAGLAQALSVVGHLSGAVMLEPEATLAAGTITVLVGSSVAVQSTTASSSSTSSTPTSVQVATTVASATSSTPTTSTTVPTPGQQPVSSSADQEQQWDPLPCPAKSPVRNVA